MLIKATKYTREDGCSIHYNEHTDSWIMSCHLGGLSYVWDEENCKWLIAAGGTINAGLHDQNMSFPVAMERLQTVQHVRIDLSRACSKITL